MSKVKKNAQGDNKESKQARVNHLVNIVFVPIGSTFLQGIIQISWIVLEL